MSFIDDQDTARRASAQDVALFRYRLIAPAIEPGLSGRQRGRLVRGIAGTVHAGPAGRPAQVSRKSLDRWIRAYRTGGFEALCPSPRQLGPRTDAAVLELASALKKENPGRTAAQVARVIAAHRGWAPSERTLQRHFVRQEIATPGGGVVHGRFEAEAPNVLWTGDVLHGPHVAGRKTYLSVTWNQVAGQRRHDHNGRVVDLDPVLRRADIRTVSICPAPPRCCFKADPAGRSMVIIHPRPGESG